ncbi:glycosyltransferase [Candidatus Parcubacteria bacterium]|nr:glycosyltransferase [Candidatus Parcubacteria bacterium]
MLSIIIPTFNEENYLPFLLQSLKKQQFRDFEVIVADAGSEDKTIEIARNYGCKICSGGLPAQGRNKGAETAKGDIFLFMDADNIYLPENFLDCLIKEFKQRNLDVASFPIFPQGNGFDKFAYKIYNNFVNLSQKFVAHATNSVLVKKKIFQAINGFDEKIKIAEDHDFAKRAFKISKFGFIKTKPVLTSTRRFEKDGRLKTYSKYLLAGLHILILGPVKSDIFNYRFNEYKGSQNKKKEV